ncbi:ABC transporter permease [Candidatus Methylocalor cossyra]|uniref:MacB_PCD domain-containing protein n=1 Tax=Candidatus Methylocalor cossyra TaxID=3108543 RepID=A0ABM9NN49_9GAMM
MVDLALKILLHDRLRFAITVAGVAFAVALVLIQVGLFMGLLDNASVMIEKSRAELWVTPRNTPNIDFAQPISETLVRRVRSTPGVARADNLIVLFTTIALPSGAREGLLVYALEDFGFWNLPWKVTEGNIDDLKRGRFMVLDHAADRRFGETRVGDYREVFGTRVKVIGRTRDALSFTTTPIAFMDHDRAQMLSPVDMTGRTHYILVKLAPGADVERVRRELQRRLPYQDVLTKAEFAQQSRRYWVESTGLGLNMGTTVFLGGLIGIVVVAQTLYTSAMEHLKEFATVKAIGGSNRDIYGILGKQALIAAVLGYGLGVLITHAVRPALAGIDLKLMVSPPLLVGVLIGAVVLCLAAALLSFHKVARIDPALVFRS